MITRIAVKNFKRLNDAECALARMTTIVGSNNSGKSSLLQALHFAATLARSARLFADAVFPDDGRPLEARLSADSTLYMPSTAPAAVFADPSQPLEIKLTDATGDCTIQVELDGDGLRLKMDGAVLGEQMLGRPNFSVLAPGLSGIRMREQKLSTGVVMRAIARGDANLVFRNVMATLLADVPARTRFITAMTSIFGAMEFRIAHNDDIDQFVSIEFQVGGRWLPIEAAGNGVLQAAQVLAYTELYSPRILMLDEPDSHLHPENQRKLCGLLAAISNAHAQNQVIVSTHSRHVMDVLKTSAKSLWVRDGKPTDAEAIHFTPMLMELGALDEIDRVGAKQPKCVVATEDAGSGLLKTLLEENGFKMVETEVLSYLGCSKADSALVLAQYLSTRSPGTRLVVHRDRDYYPDEAIAKMKARLDAGGVRLFVTRGNDVEHFFLHPEHLSEITKGKVSTTDVDQFIKEGVAATKDDSVAAMIDQRTLVAFGARKKNGDNVAHGKIGVAAVQDYGLDPAKHCHGKKTLGLVLQKLQTASGDNPKPATLSGKLHVKELEDLAREIWP